jgi:hypothetical protein
VVVGGEEGGDAWGAEEERAPRSKFGESAGV